MPAEPQIISNQIPPYSLWAIGLAIITGWIGYRWGIRSQKDAAKLAAKHDALALIDKITADIPNDFEFWRLRGRTKDVLNATVFKFSCQLGKSSRLKIEKALNDYQALDISYSFPPTEATPDKKRINEEHGMMTQGLKKLRDAIERE